MLSRKKKLASQMPLTPEKQQMVENNLGLARHVTLKFVPYINFEDTDVYSDALVGLTKAAQYFRPELGYQFSTYAYRIIRNSIFTGFAQRNRHSKLTNINVALEEFPDNSSDPVIEEPNIYEKRDMAMQLLEGLPARQRLAIEFRFFRKMTFQKSGEEMGVSKTRVHKLVEKAFQSIRRIHPELVAQFKESFYDN